MPVMMMVVVGDEASQDNIKWAGYESPHEIFHGR
jgi:hypothetical protein